MNQDTMACKLIKTKEFQYKIKDTSFRKKSSHSWVCLRDFFSRPPLPVLNPRRLSSATFLGNMEMEEGGGGGGELAMIAYIILEKGLKVFEEAKFVWVFQLFWKRLWTFWHGHYKLRTWEGFGVVW